MENKLIKINLNQTLNRFELAEIKEEKKRWLIFSIFSIIIIIIILLNSFIGYLYSGLFSSITEDTQRLIKEKNAIIQSQYENEDNNSLIDDSFTFENLTQKDVTVLYEIEIERMSVATLLEELAYNLPEDLSIGAIVYERGSQRFEIEIISDSDLTTSDAAISLFGENIKNNFIPIAEEQDGPGWGFNSAGTEERTYRGQKYLSNSIIIGRGQADD